MGQSLTRRVTLADETATIQLGADLAGALSASPAGWLILLQGDLGAGKSTLARSMLRAFGHAGAVPSPTYTLVEPYDFRSFSVYHIDLYRISSARISCFCSGVNKLHLFDKSPVLLCAAASGVFCFSNKTLFE
ncbi:MAG: tRNA (adenosine(37)-N6)-threonylcarbamoyltransferase complex ATPase subunit type 1 TsaE, partial [Gammaproteobacteria bacterium]|nr:tRNA (adenosine(37)-N6)-threonylcarbamoyltransferase complex ATPase subunit type 1 TsaE [Gammaproteobacteria bacterium]